LDCSATEEEDIFGIATSQVVGTKQAFYIENIFGKS
jgi:hypothetical protein